MPGLGFLLGAFGFVKRAAQAKAKFGLTTVFTDGDAHFDAWDAIHADRMTELGTARLPHSVLHAIRKHVLRVGKGTMCYVLEGDTVLAGCMFVGQHEVLDCFMLSGSTAAARMLATSVLIVDALAWARDAGYRIFNWQSSSDDGKTWLPAPPTPHGRTEIANLTPMATYAFRASVTHGKGTGEWSQVVSLLVR